MKNRQAFIAFENQLSAMMAKKALNGYKIEELDVTFKLDFVEPSSQIEEPASNATDLTPSGSLMFMKSSAKVRLLMTQENSSSGIAFLEADLPIRDTD